MVGFSVLRQLAKSMRAVSENVCIRPLLPTSGAGVNEPNCHFRKAEAHAVSRKACSYSLIRDYFPILCSFRDASHDRQRHGGGASRA
jgi:hypothetical protein